MSGEADRDEKGHFLPGHSLGGPGRPSSYDPSMDEQARKLALLGLTDAEIAEFFGVSEQTINNWKHDFPAFFESLCAGRVVADANVADSLYRRATGEMVEIEKIVRNRQTGEAAVIKVKSYIPGEAGAAMNWLKNRRRKDWQDKTNVEHSGVLEVASKEQRDAAVAAATRADA